jgi:hypothetical protein
VDCKLNTYCTQPLSRWLLYRLIPPLSIAFGGMFRGICAQAKQFNLESCKHVSAVHLSPLSLSRSACCVFVLVIGTGRRGPRLFEHTRICPVLCTSFCCYVTAQSDNPSCATITTTPLAPFTRPPLLNSVRLTNPLRMCNRHPPSIKPSTTPPTDGGAAGGTGRVQTCNCVQQHSTHVPPGIGACLTTT